MIGSAAPTYQPVAVGVSEMLILWLIPFKVTVTAFELTLFPLALVAIATNEYVYLLLSPEIEH